MPALEDKPDLTKVLLTVDLGGSKNKAIVQEYPEGKMEVLLLDPEVADIPQASVGSIEAVGALEGRVWIQTEDGYYVLGELARRRFGGILQLKELKYELAVPKVCGLAWLVKEKLNLNKDFAVYLVILLPSGEVQDKEQLRLRLEKTLRSFKTPSGKMRLKLLYCDFASEGSGIYFHRQAFLGNNQPVASLYVMLGYRNASVFVVRNGIISPGITSNFGMAWLVNNFVSKVSGLSADNPRIVEAIIEAGTACNPLVLQKLSRKRKTAEAQVDGELMSKALLLAREEYWRTIVRWLRSNIEEDIKELVFCGGTADYIRAEIDSYFQEKMQVNLSWHGDISISDEISTGIGNRIADVYALHQHIIGKLDQKTGYERLANSFVPVSISPNNGSICQSITSKLPGSEFDYTPRSRPKNFVNVNEDL